VGRPVVHRHCSILADARPFDRPYNTLWRHSLRAYQLDSSLRIYTWGKLDPGVAVCQRLLGVLVTFHDPWAGDSDSLRLLPSWLEDPIYAPPFFQLASCSFPHRFSAPRPYVLRYPPVTGGLWNMSCTFLFVASEDMARLAAVSSLVVTTSTTIKRHLWLQRA